MAGVGSVVHVVHVDLSKTNMAGSWGEKVERYHMCG